MGRKSLPLAPHLTRLADFLREIWRWVGAYTAHPDPRVASCNSIALLVASNQPFYPLYVYFSVSRHIAPDSADVSVDAVFPGGSRDLATVSSFRSRASAADRPC